MSVNSADFCEAIAAVWSASSLDWNFKKNWPVAQRENFPVLHDSEATPGQNFPYCIFEQDSPSTNTRMSGPGKQTKFELRDVPISFKIYAREIPGVGKSAKQIAADLADLVLQTFGGHPTVSPKTPVLTHGDFLIMQYQRDMAIRVGEEEYMWMIDYSARIDVPVKV